MNAVLVSEIKSLALWATAAEDAWFTQTLAQVASDAQVDWQAIYSALEATLPAAGPQERARLLHRLGHCALLAGDVTRALESLTTMSDLAFDLGDQALGALALVGLACLDDRIGQRNKGLEHATLAERLARGLGEQRLLALALNIQGHINKEIGQVARAVECYQQIKEIADTLGDDRLLMAAHLGFAHCLPFREAEAAMRHFEIALRVAEEFDDQEGIGVCLNNSGDWLLATGRYEESIARKEASYRHFERLQSRWGMGRALVGVARAESMRGNLDRVRAIINDDFILELNAEDAEGELHTLLNLAYLCVRVEDIERARILYRQVERRSSEVPDASCRVFAQLALECLDAGRTPPPALVPIQLFPAALSDDELSEAELAGVVGGVGRWGTYQGADENWSGLAMFGN